LEAVDLVRDLLSLIYYYFPKGIAFNDAQYRMSEEYKRLCRKRNEFKGKSSLFAKEIQTTFPEYPVVIGQIWESTITCNIKS